MDRLDKAIADFEDETLDLTMGDRITNLRSALALVAFERLKRVQKFGKKINKECEELEFKQVECQKMFKVIENMYYSQLKQNKILGKAQNDGMDKEFLKKIKEQKSSIGDIVRDLKPSDN